MSALGLAQDLAQRLRGHWRRTLLNPGRGQQALLHLPRVLSSETEACLPHCAPWSLGPTSFENLLITLNGVASLVNLSTALTPHVGHHPNISLTFDSPWRHDIENVTSLLDHYAIPASIFITPAPLEDNGLWRSLIGDALWRKRSAEQIRDTIGDAGLPLPPMPPRHPDHAYSRALLRYFLQLSPTDPKRLSEVSEHLLGILDHSLQPIDPFSLRRLENTGLFRFGAGGVRCDEQNDEGLHRQLRRSRRMLATLCRDPLAAIACPGKPSSLHTRQMLQRAGVTTALFDTEGWLTRRSDSLALPRISINQTLAQSPGRLFDHLLGFL
ncbi:polysaccharide deacetylase family protein [Halomonas sp. PR-M31]|uniref:polysaccharide deacetylase family protein n=1 Tax=Halomonas sp. PR-M31 TaxID=1471202 RepID=UPI0006502A89|nr:polysaccharide deacetylase family protein [Halomonas sp. PR-M31]